MANLDIIPITLAKRKKETVSETVFVTESIFFSSFLTVNNTFTVTERVETTVNFTHFVTLIHSFTHTVDRPTTLTTINWSTAAPRPTPTLDPIPQESGTPAPQPTWVQHHNAPSPLAIAMIVVGSLVALGIICSGAWFAMRKYRGCKAKKNQRLQGVELQRKWEQEEEEGVDVRQRNGV